MQVNISYIMQFVIILISWAALSTMRRLTKLDVYFNFPPSGRQKALKKAQHKQRRNSFQAVLSIILVEFQKAQIFFTLTIQIAALVALYDVNYIGASTWQELWNDVDFFFSIAYSGIDPIVFNLFVLRSVNMASSYLLLASSCCIAVSLLTWFSAANITPLPKFVKQQGPIYAQCGGLTTPTVYCLDTAAMHTSRGGDKAIPYVAITVLIHCCLLAEKLKVFRHRFGKEEEEVNVFQALKHLIDQHLAKRVAAIANHLCDLAVLFAESWLVYSNSADSVSYTHLTLPTKRIV